MKESEPIDALDVLLRESMGAPAPTLPPTLVQQVTRRLRPRRLSAAGRRTMQLYALVAFLAVVAVMRSQDVEWSLLAASLAATAAIAGLFRAWLW